MHSIRHPLLKGTVIEYPVTPSEFPSIKEARLLWVIFIQRGGHWQYEFPQRRFSTLDFGENKVTDHVPEEDAIAQKFQAESILYMTTFSH